MKILQLLIFFCSTTLFSFEYEISIAAIFRDEARFLKEWIEYHRMIGVEHFYLYNHCSQDHYRQVLDPYIDAGIVELIDLESECFSRRQWIYLQRHIYWRAAQTAQGVSRWIAFIDADEYIFPVEDKTLPQFLSHYQDCGAITINWLVFGTSHRKMCDPKQLMIEQLTLRAVDDYELNNEFKSIVQLEHMDTRYSGIHSFILKPGFHTVNVNREIIQEDRHDFTRPIKNIRIHHYITRDETHLEEVKLKRPPGRSPVKVELLRKVNAAANEIEDRSILIYADELRKRVFSDELR